MKVFSSAAVFLLLMLIISCKCNRQSGIPEITPEKKVELSLYRFERDMISGTPADSVFRNEMENRYGRFVEIFASRILNIRRYESRLVFDEFNRFAGDADITHLRSKCDSVFSDFTTYQDQISRAFARLQALLPEWRIPQRLITFISAFNYRVITTDSLLAVSLDMFLGNHEEAMYASVGFPRYLSRRFSPEYLVADALRGWIQSEMPEDSAGSDLLTALIRLGKEQYLMKSVLPDLPDTILFGYTAEQMNWCNQEEANIWAYFIEKNLLFNSQHQQIAKYINDGPTTSGMPKESPGNIGLFTGYKIVLSFMKRNNYAVKELLETRDANQLLRLSGYKP